MAKYKCEKCFKELNRNQVYIPIQGRHKYKNLCRDCFEKNLKGIIYNGTKETK